MSRRSGDAWSYEARGLTSRLDYANGAWFTAAYDALGRSLMNVNYIY